MKKIFALLTILLNLTIMAQSKFETYDFGTFKLHVYYSGDVMNDASYVIGGKVYYTHWAPAKAHVSNLQVSSRAAVDAEIAEAQNELNSGCELFIGGHGGASKVDAVKFKIEYLNTVKSLLAENSSADAFVKAMKSAYPELPGSEGLDALAASLCK